MAVDADFITRRQPSAIGLVTHVIHSRLAAARSEEHTSELQSLMRISYAVFCLKKKNTRRYSQPSTLSLRTQEYNNLSYSTQSNTHDLHYRQTMSRTTRT